jgi:hypothetical protein
MMLLMMMIMMRDDDSNEYDDGTHTHFDGIVSFVTSSLGVKYYLLSHQED